MRNESAQTLGTSLVVLTTVAVVLVSGGCGSTPGEDGKAVPRIDPVLYEFLDSSRDEFGLIIDPAASQPNPSIYTTALLDQASGDQLRGDVDLDALTDDLCRSPEAEIIGEPWYEWALAHLIDDPAALTCLTSLNIPEITGDPRTDVPQLYAWVHTRLLAGTSPQELGPIAGEQLTNAAVVDSPYVNWRWDQLESLLDLPGTAQIRPAPAPETISTPDELIELWSYLERCELSPDCDTADSVPPVNVASMALGAGDDLTLAAGLGVTRILDLDREFGRLLDEVKARRVSPAMLTSATTPDGTIESTFMALWLDPSLFSDDPPAALSQELQYRLSLLPQDGSVTRFQAIAILQAIDEPVYSDYAPEVDELVATIDAASYTASQLPWIAAMAPVLGVLEVSASPHLELFEVTDAESSYHARLALAHSWMFSNGDEVAAHFAAEQEGALAQATTPSEPLPLYIAGLSALTGPGLTIPQDNHATIKAELDSSLKGCIDNGMQIKEMYRMTLDPDSPCSLRITYLVAASGYGVFE